MPATCTIVFDNDYAVYEGGETIRGTVKLRTTSQKTISGIYVQVTGTGRVYWPEGKASYSAEDKYINFKTYVLGSLNGPSFDLAPGDYLYNFNLELPPNLPTTIYGSIGRITYVARAVIECPSSYNDSFESDFTVIQKLDLRVDENYKRSISAKAIESFFCPIGCCFGNSTVAIKLNIPYRGYTAGQLIRYKLSIKNDMLNKLNEIKVKLQQRMVYKSRLPIREKWEFSTVKKNVIQNTTGLREGDIEDFIKIPPIPPSSNPLLDLCIEVDYCVIAKVTTGYNCTKIIAKVPITIGTVPVLESLTDPYNRNENNVVRIHSTAPMLNLNISTDSNRPPSYCDSVPSPPTYEEAINLGNFFNDNTNGAQQRPVFIPKYPVYLTEL